MTEESKNQGIPKESMAHIKTLFSRLTEIILSTCISRKGVADAIVAVGNWTGVIFASLIIMVETQPLESNIRADQITSALNEEIRKHMTMLRGMKNSVEKPKIILPKHMR